MAGNQKRTHKNLGNCKVKLILFSILEIIEHLAQV